MNPKDLGGGCLGRDLQRGWVTFQGTLAAPISLPYDQGNQNFQLEIGLITHFLLQEVTSRKQLCNCPVASLTTARHYPDSEGSDICRVCGQLDQMARGPKPGTPVFRMTPLCLVTLLKTKTHSNNSTDDSTGGHHQTVYLTSDYVLCPQRWRRSIQSAKMRPGADWVSDLDS